MAERLIAAGYSAPRVWRGTANGLLLEDLGDNTLQAFAAGRAGTLYRLAMDVLVTCTGSRRGCFAPTWHLMTTICWPASWRCFWIGTCPR